MPEKKNSVAIIGTGATTIFVLKNIYKHAVKLLSSYRRIVLFEKDPEPGMGMPYNPRTTDIYNMANISSEEIPALDETFVTWLRKQDDAFLSRHNIAREDISDHEVYGRLVMGAYLHSQYRAFLDKLREAGFEVIEKLSVEVSDIRPYRHGISIIPFTGEKFLVHKVIIATGHFWKDRDFPRRKYYASPWPISKLLPPEGNYLNFEVGILGASLSAFDVVSSLAHRHGKFIEKPSGTMYLPFENTDRFKLILHDAQGWLPHLQYQQLEPMRKIYRHVSRKEVLALMDDTGHLRIDNFFDRVCRPVLRRALISDGKTSFAKQLEDPDFGMGDFIEVMSVGHEYENAFEGMRLELKEASKAIAENKPIHWKEALDDLMYCLNYHAELLPAEDHIFFQQTVMPFLLNVIAAMPLRSANILLALYDAGKLELKSGKVEVLEEQPSRAPTCVELKGDDGLQRLYYDMFVVCSGLGGLEFDAIPFPSLRKGGWIQPAQARFIEKPGALDGNNTLEARVVYTQNDSFYLIGGVDIDAGYRVIGTDGNPNHDIIDVAFTHTPGLRPYSYGLQACAATAAIMVDTWAESVGEEVTSSGNIRDVSKHYQENAEI